MAVLCMRNMEEEYSCEIWLERKIRKEKFYKLLTILYDNDILYIEYFGERSNNERDI